MMQSISIDDRAIGPSHSPYIIAELSANHNGSVEHALQTIDAARQAGADAIKLQTYTADTMTIDCDREEFMIRGGVWDGYKLYELYRWAETPFEWHQAMFAHARKLGITIFSTPFDESAVDLLEELDTPAYKIASFENTDSSNSLCCEDREAMIMSTGMATEDEIAEAADAAALVAPSWCATSCSYPAPIDQANVRQLAELARCFDVMPGLSDHTLGTTASVAAVALGACVIENISRLTEQIRGPTANF